DFPRLSETRLQVQLQFTTKTAERFISALDYSDPKLCYVLDGFLGLYGLIITGMFIKEKGRHAANVVGSGSRTRRRPRRGLKASKYGSSATRDTYDSLQMQPLPAR
uniref:T-cell surface glycoprotein CD3 zeta chain n=1 Tax=Xiphophorus maculatus TaxID=8083 RepID=A0A3B5RDM6_XIPMA